ncbi:MAG: DUF4199 domain-containing protein [Alistipes sp.]|nr:DUF4199 domain-containing protein [Alistipes sp.]
MNRDFWYDVLRSGAIIGFVMALSFVAERYLLAFSQMPLLKASVIYMVEWLVVCGVFIWLLVRFTRRIANAADPKLGFPYSLALSYILMVSALAGVLVGVADTAYISTMGYDIYVNGIVERITQLKEMYLSMGVPASEMDMFDDYASKLRFVEQPSMWLNVVSKLQSYMIFGGLPGFIIAGVVSRRPSFGEPKDNQ